MLSMPLFKKVSIDNGTMLEIHRRALRRCRTIFLKDLDASLVMEYLASDDGFRQEQRDQILSCQTREQRTSSFLDHLETRGERAFSLFLEALKACYKHLFAHLEETIQSIVDWDSALISEKSCVDGMTLRRLLTKRKSDIGSQMNEDCELTLEKTSALPEGNSSDYISCYSVTTRGHLQKERWITHIDTSKSDAVQMSEKSYMAVVCASLVFKRIDWSSMKLAANFRKPPSSVIPAYMFEKESIYMMPPISRQTSHEVGEPKKKEKSTVADKRDIHDCIPTALFRVRSSVPPPVPPKPENLPILGLGGCPPLPKPRRASDIPNITAPPRTTSQITLPQGKIRPPVPKKKKVPTATLR